MPTSRSVAARLRNLPNLTGSRAYAFAAGLMVLAVIVTRATWPVFARAPFFVMFGATYFSARFATKRAALLAVLLGAVGSQFASPDPHSAFTAWPVVAVYVIVGLIAIQVISERNRAVRALQVSEAQFRATWEHAALGAAQLNRHGQVERINPALERMLGHPAATWARVPFDRFTHPDDVAEAQSRLSALLGGFVSDYQCEQRYLRDDGVWIWCRVTVSGIRGQGGGVPTGVLMAFEDISARRKAEADLRASEEKLRQAQKMEAVGQLVAGVAHNFNNLLTITMGYTDILLDRHRGTDADRADLEEIRQATARASSLTRQLLAFSRQKETAPALIDLNRAVSDLQGILTRAVREDIDLRIVVGPDPATVLIDRQDFEQVILNLVINARDALPGGGVIDITIGHQPVDPTLCPPDQPEGDYVSVAVRDNGVGMSADVQEHLFEPFFTTKEVGQGTGLGLASTYGTVRHHHGFVTVASAPGQGTTVTLWFPPSTAPAPAVAEPAPPPAMESRGPASRATILLVEDEASVRLVTSGTLTRAGHRVLEAATPTEAIAVFDRHVDDIDLLLTDVVMPEMRGPVLAERLTAKKPGLPVLLMSGYSESGAGVVGGLGTAAFVAKPFTASQLLSAVSELLT